MSAAQLGHVLGQVLIDGEWQPSDATSDYESTDPTTGKSLGRFPLSSPAEVEVVLAASVDAAAALRATGPEQIAAMLDELATLIEHSAEELVRVAASETGLPTAPRLRDVELPRTTGQLRQAAQAARQRMWRDPQLCPTANIAAWRSPLPGAVVVLGPNNFPFAFNPAAGGDMAAAIATHHPVIAKSNPGHPATTALLAELARQAALAAGLPAATVQLVHGTESSTGLALVADRRIAATAYTGSRRAGLALKASADAAGVPIFAEMSALNPVVVLPGAAGSRPTEIADELAGSVTGSGGQLCTKPGLIVVERTSSVALRDRLVADVDAAPIAVVLGAGVVASLRTTTEEWERHGVVRRSMQRGVDGPGHRAAPAVYETDAETFLTHSEHIAQEAFGPVTLLVVADDADQMLDVIGASGASLTGSVYSDDGDADDYRRVRDRLLPMVGRFLDDKTPTGVAVVGAMHHGGPYPASADPSSTSVGIPQSLLRFTARQAFDHVRDDHLPPELQAANPLGLWRNVDQRPSNSAITWGAE